MCETRTAPTLFREEPEPEKTGLEGAGGSFLHGPRDLETAMGRARTAAQGSGSLAARAAAAVEKLKRRP